MKHKACSFADLETIGKMRVLINERPLLVVAFEGKAYAMNDKCPHKGAPLSPGKYESGIIQCKEHGLQIDARTGIVVNNLKSKFLVPNEESRSIKTYVTTIEDGSVFIEI